MKRFISSTYKLSVLLLFTPVVANSQVYQVPSPAAPQLALDLVVNGTHRVFFWNWWGSQGLEHVYIDASAQTIRQVGAQSVSLAGSHAVTEHYEVQLPPVFPNPPQTRVLADLTVSLSMGIPELLLTFDTGNQPITWTGSYTFDHTSLIPFDVNVPVIGEYSLVAEEETYTGSFSYTVHFSGIANAHNSLSTVNYPESISLGGGGGMEPGILFSGTLATVVDIVAANGSRLEVQAGSGYLGIPEPTSGSLLTLGVLGALSFIRRRPRC